MGIPHRDRRAFIAAALALAVLFTGNNIPSALYGLFRVAFGFSALTQTLLYSVAVAVILGGLLVFGPLSDLVGRRMLVVAGLIVFGLGDALFAAAHGTAWLYAARVAQGLGMGLATAAASATLGDTSAGLSEDPVRGQHIAALTGTVCITGGLAVGPLLAGVLAQYGPAPRQLSFLVHLGLILAALAVAAFLPGPPARRVRWRLARLTVPERLRPVFGVLSAAGFLAWAVLGVFSAVIPSLLGVTLGTRNLAVTAGALTVMIGMSAVAQLAARRVPVVTAQVMGLAVLATGLGVLAGATLSGSVVLAVLAMVCCGVGHGLVFGGEMTQVLVATPPPERAATLGRVYFVNYAGLGGPVIAVGAAALAVGLVTATRVASVVIAAGCVVLMPVTVRVLRAHQPTAGPVTRSEPSADRSEPSADRSGLAG